MDTVPTVFLPAYYIYERVVPKTEKWILNIWASLPLNKRPIFDPVGRHQVHARHARKEKLVLDIRETLTKQSPRYEYDDLAPRQIRMLQIDAAPRSDPISCSLLTWSIDSPPAPFEALSYTWGNAKDRHWIAIDGKAIQVTKSLLGALQQFRHMDRARILWVDAVCINQENVPERGAQVQLMDLIYQRAERVLVWLGVAHSQSTSAFELMNKISGVMSDERSEQNNGNDGNNGDDSLRKYTVHKDIVTRGLPASDDPAWLALDALFWRPWFLRVWVVQEVCVSRVAVVVCGFDSIDFDVFCGVANYLNRTSLGPLAGVSVDRVLSLRTARSRYQSNDRDSLTTQLIISRNCLATNAVDKVYALLNIAKDIPPDAALRPDYHKTADVVFSDVARILLSRSLDILNFNCDRVWRMQPNLPSWAPDWSCVPREVSFLFAPKEPLWHAGSAEAVPPAPSVRFSQDNRVLLVQGRILDKITTIGESYFTFNAVRMGKAHNDWYTKYVDKNEYSYRFSRDRRWMMWERMALRLKTYPATGEDIRTVFQKTITAGSSFLSTAKDGNQNPPNLETMYNAFRKVQSFEPYAGYETMTDEDLRVQKYHHDLYYQEVHMAAYSRKLFTTQKGYIGLGPVSTAPGHYVAILHTGRTAYVLKKKTRADQYALVGEAYLHGFMHGEGLHDGNPLEEFGIE